ncbi:MAG: hypothetical protein GY853_02955 [PVC group bacterium]|nr:hypothetical protein [PVC group bacterium]
MYKYESKNRLFLKVISFIIIQAFLYLDLSFAANSTIMSTLSPSISINKSTVMNAYLDKLSLEPAFAGICITKDSFSLTINSNGKNGQTKTFLRTNKDIIEAIREDVEGMRKKGNPLKVHGVAIEGKGLSANEKAKLGSNLWLNNDIVPVKIFENLPNGTSEQISQNAASLAANSFEVDEVGLVIRKVMIDKNREIQVNPLVTLDEYKKITPPKKWHTLLHLVKLAKKRKLNMVFVNSTAQGGGVALMRHALIRLYKLLGIDAHWLAMDLDGKEFEDIPNITKKKMHNALQNTNAANFDHRLTEHDKQRLKAWTNYNFKLMEPKIKRATVVIIDDYQPSGLIPLIKEKYPHIKILYRSHIQIRSNLTDLPLDDSNSTKTNWKYIFENLWDARKNKFHIEAFVTHPVDAFIPNDIRRHKKIIIKKGAASDISKQGLGGLDGLNKFNYFSKSDKSYYMNMFNTVLNLSNKRILQIADKNELSKQQENLLNLLENDNRVNIKDREDQKLRDFLAKFQQEPLDFTRPYILQICRFDPAKGILDLLKAYKVFRDKLGETYPKAKIPQLVIAGHGAIDDPEGMPLYNKYLLEAYLEYKELFSDIKIARIGHNDQILGVLAANDWVGTQLSTAEGYEIKISELGSLEIPTIITDLPGPVDQAVPVRKKAGKITGSTFIVSRNGAQELKVANRLYSLFTNKKLYESVSANARANVKDDVDTVQNAIDWLWMSLEAIENEDGINGYGKRIVDLIEEKQNSWDKDINMSSKNNHKIQDEINNHFIYEQSI